MQSAIKGKNLLFYRIILSLHCRVSENKHDYELSAVSFQENCCREVK